VRRVTDEGFAMSSPVALMAGAAVLMAGIGFFATGHASDDPAARPVALAAARDVPVEPQVTLRAVPAKPVVDRGSIYVSVFNNSNITGLAAGTAARIADAGWQVVATDNWYGTIPATTIYYPDDLERAARMLSKDLGIARVMPAVDPMSMDRLTVILTSDFA
jgi:hypothetical protein